MLLMMVLLAAGANAQKLTRQQYINKYKDIAIEQMHKYKIPASIILAQGCLESGDGNSALARKANNHFGIKCHDGWRGKKFRQDDDAKNECFRKYKNAIDSYTDHSYFLTSRPRYNSLFDLPITDYKAWAHGLKAAGYATNPKYAKLLIDIIEEYELYKYDTKEAYAISREQKRAEKKAAQIEKKKKKLEKRAIKAAKKAQKANHKYYEFTGQTPQTTIPALNAAAQPPKATPAPAAAKDYIVKKGDTLYSIARKHGMTVSEIQKLNPGINANSLKIGARLKLK